MSKNYIGSCLYEFCRDNFPNPFLKVKVRDAQGTEVPLEQCDDFDVITEIYGWGEGGNSDESSSYITLKIKRTLTNLEWLRTLNYTKMSEFLAQDKCQYCSKCNDGNCTKEDCLNGINYYLGEEHIIG